jgi:hypothetical protein
MKSLNEQILVNILTELNMAKAKRSALVDAGLETDKIDARIAVLEVAKNEQERMILEDAK